MLAIFKKYIKKPWVIAVLVVLLIIVFVIIKKSSAQSDIQTYTVQKTDVNEEVSVTGKVTPFQKSDLGFEKGGTVVAVYFKVGDHIKKGNTIGALNDRETQASLLSAQASLAAAQANLADNISNTNITYINAQKSAIDAARDAHAKTQNVILNQADSFFSNGQSANPVLNIPANNYMQQRDIENKRVQVGLALNNWKAKIDANSNPADAEVLLGTVREYLRSVSDFMSTLSATVLAIRTNSSGTPQATIDAYIASINSANTNLNTAISGITSAENTLATAAPKSIKSLQARVQEAQATVANYQAQYSKSVVVAPFDGIITTVNPQIGDVVSAGQTQFSVISDQGFKVEANIPEADIAKIKTNQKAAISLDAYGPDVVFNATVDSIDPAETVVDAVPTYKTTFIFTSSDERIKSGMTANIDVEGDIKTNVLAVPQRAIINRNGSKYVTVQKSDKTTEDVAVTTGLKGSDGKVEITSGITEGDIIVIAPAQ